ncbi:hypothetical protein BT63DRAFT_409429 [Microthyrium microscopicum]|uniref:Nitrogen regulatory protein areA GATA-like domain-containing protein n=1 Tax=Microthyrium microscopicum TaxID=703497 RepID=A0A6A6UV69_9PEZI|nr:hypothetical protein BT63DRAFT_409429 [Microthyrium microscopicum]
MATVLPSANSGSEGLRRSSSAGGLRRNNSSTRSLNLLNASSTPSSAKLARYADYAENKKPVKSKSNRSSRKATPSASSEEQSPSPDSAKRRDTEQQSTRTANKFPLALHVFDVTERRDDEQVQAPPSSPDSSSPPSVSSPSDEHPAASPPIIHLSGDDMAIKDLPTSHVDYLSYSWKIEEVSASWRHVVSDRYTYGQSRRLENASWRAWWKQLNGLRSLPPEHLNWLKENDTTWLYGPKQNAGPWVVPYEQVRVKISQSAINLNKRPILKKRTLSQAILQCSISNSSLVRQAATVVQAQQARPLSNGRRASDFARTTSFITLGKSYNDVTDYFSSSSTSGLQTPSELGERKHISFNDQVEQYVAIELKDPNGVPERQPYSPLAHELPDDEDVLVMRYSRRRIPPRKPKKKSTEGPVMIAKVEPTTLNDGKMIQESMDSQSHSLSRNRFRGQLSPSPSSETLRPTDPSKNYLIRSESDEELSDLLNSVTFDAFADGYSMENAGPIDEEHMLQTAHDEADHARGMRRTPSGMLMPDDDSQNGSQTGGVVGAIIDGMNTARDIATVVWNVGWRR